MLRSLFRRSSIPAAADEAAASPPDQQIDQALIARAREGDAAAFGLLYERHVTRVYRYITYRTGRQEAADDLTAEVFLNAWKAIARYEERGYSVRAWLLRLAQNEVVDYYRQQRPDSPLPDYETAAFALPGPELHLEREVERASLVRAVGMLPDEWQQVILLHFVEELSFDEIGLILGKRSGTCRQIQHRALNRLRDVLNNQERRR